MITRDNAFLICSYFDMDITESYFCDQYFVDSQFMVRKYL
jgi:hypothetical protein